MNSNLQKIINEFNLSKLNTLTKYPSILTYHNLAERGSLDNSLVENRDFSGQKVYITEKIDGTNSRIVFTTNENGKADDYLIGSREDILFAYNDRIINNTLGIVNTVKPVADSIKLFSNAPSDALILKPNSLYVVYGETFGGSINAAKQYTSHKTYGFRLFDVWCMDISKAKDILDDDISKISTWREHSGQPFFNVEDLNKFAEHFFIPVVPYIEMFKGEDIPTTLSGVYDWLDKYSKTNISLDNDFDGGKSEGVVVRTFDRSLIRKIRFEDYEKSKKMKKF